GGIPYAVEGSPGRAQPHLRLLRTGRGPALRLAGGAYLAGRRLHRPPRRFQRGQRRPDRLWLRRSGELTVYSGLSGSELVALGAAGGEGPGEGARRPVARG